MISIEGEVTKVGAIQQKGNFTFRNIELYYGNAENPILCMKAPLCYDCDLKVGDQVRIDFEIKAPRGYNNLYVTRYRKLNLGAKTPSIEERKKTEMYSTGVSADTEDEIRLDDETERALDDIFGPESEETRRKQENRKAVEEKMNTPMLQTKRQQLAEEQNQPFTNPLVQNQEDNEENKSSDLAHKHKKLIGFF